MAVRTRDRIDNETVNTWGIVKETWLCNKSTSVQSFPFYGPWSFAPLGISGKNLIRDHESRNAIGQYMVENWRDFAKHTVDSGSAAVGYSHYGRSTITDVPTKNFRKLSAQGAIINNAYSRTKVKIDSSLVQDVATDVEEPNGFNQNESNYVLQIYIHSAVETRTTRSLSLPKQVIDLLRDIRPDIPGRQTAINNAYGNIQQGEVELLVMAAEGRKTVQHLISVVFRFAKLVRALKTGNFRDISPKVFKKWKEGAYGKTATVADVFSDAWMEARYAWVPTIMDAIGSFNILTGNVEKRLTYRGKSSDNFSVDIDRTVDCGIANVRLKAVVYGDLSCRAGVLTAARFDSPNAQNLGIFNVATAVKEVIPYSFVLEWFVNLSGVLYHLNPNPLLKSLAAWATDTRELRVNGQIEWKQPDGKVLTVPILGQLLHKERNPISGPGLLTIDVNLGIARIIDGAILLLRNLR